MPAVSAILNGFCYVQPIVEYFPIFVLYPPGIGYYFVILTNCVFKYIILVVEHDVEWVFVAPAILLRNSPYFMDQPVRSLTM